MWVNLEADKLFACPKILHHSGHYKFITLDCQISMVMQKTLVRNMKCHTQAFHKIVFKAEYVFLMGFNEEKDEIDHKTQAGADLVKWHGSGIGCVISVGLRRESLNGKYSNITTICNSQYLPGR